MVMARFLELVHLGARFEVGLGNLKDTTILGEVRNNLDLVNFW